MAKTGMTQAPAGRPPTPWLAVLMLPALFGLPPETILMLGDLERCLAWGIIEGDS